MDLWLLLVEYVWGSFYACIFGMAFIFLIILMMGGVSIFTSVWFCGIFLFVMMLGNGVWIIVLPISMGIIFMFLKGCLAFYEATYWGGNR